MKQFKQINWDKFRLFFLVYTVVPFIMLLGTRSFYWYQQINLPLLSLPVSLFLSMFLLFCSLLGFIVYTLHQLPFNAKLKSIKNDLTTAAILNVLWILFFFGFKWFLFSFMITLALLYTLISALLLFRTELAEITSYMIYIVLWYILLVLFNANIALLN